MWIPAPDLVAPTVTLRRRLVLLATAALVLAGCTGDDVAAPGRTGTATDTVGPTTTTSPSPTAPGATSPVPAPMAATETCEADRFAIEYPQGWQTNDPAVIGAACRVFHPSAIDLEPGTEVGFQWAAAVRLEDVAFDRASLGDARGYMLLEQRETAVAGHQAVVAEQRTTEEAPLVPAGTRVYRWTIEVDADTVMVATTYDVGDVDHQLEKRVLDAMMRTLDVDASATAMPTEGSPTSVQGSGDPVTVTDVRVTTAHDMTRVILPVSGGGRPGWRAQYVAEPTAQGSGDPVEVAGDATLVVTVTNTGYPGDTGAEHSGADRASGAGVVAEVVHGTIFEGGTRFYVGVEGQQRPFTLNFAEAEREIVIDLTGT